MSFIPSLSVYLQFFLFSACFALISDGMHIGWMSIALTKLMDGSYDFSITSDEASWLASMITLGSLTGTILAYMLTNRYGKKNLIFVSIIPLIISWILTAAGPTAPFLFVGKFVAGMADGLLYSTVPTFIAEISEPKIRGFLGSIYSASLVFGMLLINLLLYTLPIRDAGYIAIVFSLPLLLTFPFLPDSAYYYLMQNDYEAAKVSLQKYYGRGDIDEELKYISEAVNKEMQSGESVLNVFYDKTSRKALIIAVILSILSQFTGIAGILMFCTTLFQESESILDPELSNIIFFVVYCIAVTVSALVVDVSGRKCLLFLSSLGLLISLIANASFLLLKQYAAIEFNNLGYFQLVVLMFYIIFFAFGWNSVPFVVISEIFSPSVRRIGLFLSNIFFDLSATIVLKYFTWTNDMAGKYLSFYTFAFWSFIAVLFTKFFLIETNGKTLEEIQTLLRGKT